ncbi:hypothetical protein GQ53DRAFT_756200 [Thozetella sp. PMI_491]|nr:hypothetical protein GQ53DRAFT_756603 [Thozetella sp. PMI_491]KAH8879102.1 hypothetical protein GQ53DRAFT_756200 [Thozetella sp. PMI_491]
MHHPDSPIPSVERDTGDVAHGRTPRALGEGYTGLSLVAANTTPQHGLSYMDERSGSPGAAPETRTVTRARRPDHTPDWAYKSTRGSEDHDVDRPVSSAQKLVPTPSSPGETTSHANSSTQASQPRGCEYKHPSIPGEWSGGYAPNPITAPIDRRTPARSPSRAK